MSGTANDFPLLNPVLIEPISTNGATPVAGRSFAINTSFEPYRRDAFRHRSIASQRESIDLTDLPGEGTVNTEGLWRRGAVSWHDGAGQLYADRKQSDDNRFYTSKGVDPWTPYQLGLLPAVTNQLEADGTLPFCDVVVCSNCVYVLRSTGALSESPSGNVIFYSTTDGYASSTTPTGLSGVPYYIATDGGTTVKVVTSTGIYTTTPGAASWTLQVTNGGAGAFGFIGYANGHWLFGNGPTLYDITTTVIGDPLPTPIPSAIQQTGWLWTGVTSGEGFIYICGVAVTPVSLLESQGGVYGLTMNQADPTNTTLLGPVLALPMPTGELPQCIYSYDNFIFIGSNLGVRMCSINNANDPSGQQGQLTSGPLLPSAVEPIQPLFTSSQNIQVKGFVGFGRYVWFIWPGYDSVSTGLGRMDIGNLQAPLQPAYASDLMAPAAGGNPLGLAWCPITNGPVFINGGDGGGLYTQTVSEGYPVPVASGTLNAGRVTWGIPDMKLVAQANYNTASDGTILPDGYTAKTLGGTVSMSVIYDGGSEISLAPNNPNTQENPPVLVSPLTSAEEVQIIVNLTSGDDQTEWVFLTRWTAKALAQVASGITISPVLMNYVTSIEGGQERYTDPYGDYLFFENLRLSRTPCIYKEGSGQDGATQFTAVVTISEIDFLPYKERDVIDAGYEGDMVVYLQSLVG